MAESSGIRGFARLWKNAFKGQVSTIAFHVLTAAIVLYFTHVVDVANTPWQRPLVYLILLLPFLYLQRQALNAGVSHGHYHRAPHPRINGAFALIVSWVGMWALLYIPNLLFANLKGNAYQFMYEAMSYTACLALPKVISGIWVVRVLTARFRVCSGLTETPLLSALPYFFLFAMLLPAGAAYYLEYSNPWFATELIDTYSVAAKDVDEMALRVGVVWRNAVIVSAVLLLGMFYALYSWVDLYPRRPQTALIAIMAPMLVIAVIAYRLALFVVWDYAWIVQTPDLSGILSAALTFKWNLHAWLISFVSAVPIIVVGLPFLIVAWNDPLKETPTTNRSKAERLQLERHLLRRDQRERPWNSLPDSDKYGRQIREHRVARHDEFRDWKWTATRAVLLLWLRLARAQTIAFAIWRTNLTALIFTLPISFLAALRPLVFPDHALDVNVIVFGLITSSLVWIGVLTNNLYFFQTTAQQAFEAGLLDTVRRLNEHTIIVGYDDLGRRLAARWARRNLLGYVGPHDHLLRGPNIVLPDGRMGRMMANVTIVDELSPSGIGLVGVGAGVKASAISLTEVIRPMQGEIIEGLRDDPAIVVSTADVTSLRPQDGWLKWLRHHLNRLGIRALELAALWLAKATRDYDFMQAQLVEFYAPLVAGDASSMNVRDAAQFSRATFVVSAPLRSRDADAGFASIESMEMLRLRGVECPMTVRLNSSALTPQILSRTMVDDVPLHAVSVDRLEASEPIVGVATAILKRMRTTTSARVMVAARGKRLFHLLDGVMALLEPAERETFGSPQLKTPHLLMVVSDDPVINELPGQVPGEEWEKYLTPLENAGLSYRFVNYLPYVTRWKQHDGHVVKAKRTEISERVTKGIWVLHVNADCRDHQSVVLLEKELQPNVIMISDAEMISGLRSLNGLGVAVSRQSPLPSIQVFVAADRSRWVLSQYYWNALWFAAAPSGSAIGEDGLFPSLKDCYIDPLLDAVERISGLWSAYSKKFIGRPASKVVEVHTCSSNRPGAIADTLVRLCGGKRTVVGINDESGQGYSVSFLDTRLEMRRDGRFALRTLCQLETMEPVVTAEGTVARGKFEYPDHWLGCRMAIQSIHAPERNSAANHVLGALGHKTLEGSVLLERTAHARSSCCGMLSCPIEASHKVLATAPDAETSAETDPELKKAEKGRILDKLADRYWAASSDQPVWGTLEAPKFDEIKRRPLAVITLDCDAAFQRGTFAVAAGSLLGWRVDCLEGLQDVVHLTYLSGGECHDNKYGLFSVYGFTEKEERRQIRPVERVVGNIKIRPVSGDAEWDKYATALHRFLNRKDAADTPARSANVTYSISLFPGQKTLQRIQSVDAPQGNRGDLLDEDPVP